LIVRPAAPCIFQLSVCDELANSLEGNIILVKRELRRFVTLPISLSGIGAVIEQ
jgi:hypothetical protein